MPFIANEIHFDAKQNNISFCFLLSTRSKENVDEKNSMWLLVEESNGKQRTQIKNAYTNNVR